MNKANLVKTSAAIALLCLVTLVPTAAADNPGITIPNPVQPAATTTMKRRSAREMWVIYLEMGVALALLALIVWFTWRRRLWIGPYHLSAAERYTTPQVAMVQTGGAWACSGAAAQPSAVALMAARVVVSMPSV